MGIIKKQFLDIILGNKPKKQSKQIKQQQRQQQHKKEPNYKNKTQKRKQTHTHINKQHTQTTPPPQKKNPKHFYWLKRINDVINQYNECYE